MAFTAPCVPTGMKTGVLTRPCAVSITPAGVPTGTFNSEFIKNKKCGTKQNVREADRSGSFPGGTVGFHEI